MNRRQEIIAWLIGLILIAVCLAGRSNGGDWLIEAFLPVLIFGCLLLYSLRTRTVSRVATTTNTTVAIATALIVGSMLAATQRLSSMVEAAQESSDQAASEAGEVSDKLDAIESRLR